MASYTTNTSQNSKIIYPLILFDGYCNLCSGAVNLILKNEKKPLYYFISLQSATVKEYFPDLRISDPPESLILIENNKIFKSSTAALKISKNLKFPWYIFYYAIFLPSFLRDPVYQFIARHRYKWFGRKSVCFVPTTNWKSRFLD